jgi:hypothetical protein
VVEKENANAITNIPPPTCCMGSIMLRNISVRTFIIYFLLVVLLIIDGLVWTLSESTTLFIAVNIINVLAVMLLWSYMTKYLVTPINTVKKRGHLRQSCRFYPRVWQQLCGAFNSGDQ